MIATGSFNKKTGKLAAAFPFKVLRLVIHLC